MGLSDDETLCKPLRGDCLIHVRTALPKRSGDALERWEKANVPELVGRTVTVDCLEVRGLTKAAVRYELTRHTRLGFQHVCNKWWRQQQRRQRP